MIGDKIYDSVKEMSMAYGIGDEYNPMIMLSSFAKLILLDRDILQSMFSEDEIKEIDSIKSVFEENMIEAKLVVSATPFLIQNRYSKEDSEILKKKIDCIEKNDEKQGSSQVLKTILSLPLPEIELLKKQHSIDDVLACLDKKEDGGNEDNNKLDEKKEETTKSDSKDESSLFDALNSIQNKDSEKETEHDIEQITEHGRERLSNLAEKTKDLYNALACKVKGQDEAINVFAQGIFQSEIMRGLEEEKKGPRATFLFAGPSGVGKTYLSTVAKEQLDKPFLRLNMTEYCLPGSVHDLFGGNEPGKLTDFVRKNPYSIVLLDEIDKCFPSILNQFIQILDGGSVFDIATGRSVDFKNTILIFTTNAGKGIYDDRNRQNLSTISTETFFNAVMEEKNMTGGPLFPPALCSRLSAGNVIIFNHLGVNTLIELANDKFDEYSNNIKELYDLSVDVSDELANVLIFSLGSQADARKISSQAELMLKNELYEFSRHLDNPTEVFEKLEKLEVIVDTSHANKEVKALFSNDETSEVLFVGEKDKLKSVPFSERCKVLFAEDCDSAVEQISKNSIRFVLIDPLYKASEEYQKYISLDDRKSEGIIAFEQLSDKFPNMPIYVLNNDSFTENDKALFFERGAREFVDFKTDLEFADVVSKICDTICLQSKIDGLSRRGRVLKYNTAQLVEDEGKTAKLVFYDFAIKMEPSAEDNQLIMSDTETPKDRFDDVIGAENAKEELKYFVDYLKNPQKFMANSVKPSKGIFLYGPPGTGKTLLARAMAGEAGVTFIPYTGTEFMASYYGESEDRVRNLFSAAKKYAPSIIFIDEIDAIAKERTGSDQTVHTERILNTLLTEMDGFKVDESRPVFVIAATNYNVDGKGSNAQTRIDPALVRRFDNRIYVDLPNEAERELFINRLVDKIEKHKITKEALHSIAQRTTGLSLAIIKNVVDLALRNANKTGEEVNDKYIYNALEEYMYGEKKEWNEEYFKSVAIHESGHAYLCNLSGEKPSYITIVSRGNFGGYMQHANEENIASYTKEQLLWKIRVALAGRAAELEFFGEESGTNTGVASDIENATNLALSMICYYAMDSDSLVSVSPDKIITSPLGEKVLQKVNLILKEELEKTRQLIREGKDKIQSLADYLIENNQANEDDISRILNG